MLLGEIYSKLPEYFTHVIDRMELKDLGDLLRKVREVESSFIH